MEPTQARKALFQFALWGLGLTVIGTWIAGATRPHFDQLGLYSGDEAGFWFGLIIAWIGTLLLLVPVVAWGVKLGREAWPTGTARPAEPAPIPLPRRDASVSS